MKNKIKVLVSDGEGGYEYDVNGMMNVLKDYIERKNIDVNPKYLESYEDSLCELGCEYGIEDQGFEIDKTYSPKKIYNDFLDMVPFYQEEEEAAIKWSWLKIYDGDFKTYNTVPYKWVPSCNSYIIDFNSNK